MRRRARKAGDDRLAFLSVCSGIEAVSVAWKDLPFRPVAFAEIDPFCSQLLAHHYPDVPNLGDFTIIGAKHGPVDVLVGGTPCQSFSVAGLRGGLSDDRGNLALQFLKLAQRVRADWVLWENVPGVLSSVSHDAPPEVPPGDDVAEGTERVVVEEYEADERADFACFLAGLQELGYGFAYRILDAQYVGGCAVHGDPAGWGPVPQRRRRVFVVAHLGDWAGPAAVLFERAGLRGDLETGGETREDLAGTLGGGAGGRGSTPDTDRMTFLPEVAAALATAPYADGSGPHNLVAPAQLAVDFDNVGLGEVSGTLKAAQARCSSGHGVLSDGPWPAEVTGPLDASFGRLQGQDDQHALNGGATFFVPGAPMAFDPVQVTHRENRSQPAPGRECHTLSKENAARATIAFSSKDHGADASEEISPTLRAGGHTDSHPNGGAPPAVAFHMTQDPISGEISPALGATTMGMGMEVRRLTPRECERLQGFPDDYTLVPIKGKPAADGPRYKALGNSMARTVMRWLGGRLVAVDAILKAQK